eukprot:8885823-Ditylum_brightwellii.AAC.1
MKVLPLCEGFYPYSAKAYFNLDQKCTRIYDSARKKLYVTRYDRWEKAKFEASSLALVLTTAREHLMQYHMAVANYVSISSINHLLPICPICCLINVLTFCTNYINDMAFFALVPKNSILHHGSPFKHK